MNKVINWSLTLKFKTKEQSVAFVNFMNSRSVELWYEYRPEFEEGGYVYYVELNEVPWASNLTEISEFLESINHGLGE